MKQQTVCILLALILVSATYADALVFVYAKTCSSCKAYGAKSCGYGYIHSKGYVSCDGATAIRSCSDCQRRLGRCRSGAITECYIG
uniref:Gambicin n=1 Tax=Ochlerotatus triseriatus TaxID=7162 RepID=C6ZQS2_OCHTR